MAEFYKDIYDCPVDAYHKCIENDYDLSHLVKSGKYDKSMDEELAGIFIKIQDQKIDEFGTSPKFEAYFHKLVLVNELEIRLIDGDESAETFLMIAQRELDKLKESMTEEVDIRKDHVRLKRSIQTQYQGRNTVGMTVFEFYTDIADLMKRQEEEQRKQYWKRKRAS